MFKFENYQSAIFGSSSSDSVANIEKKFGNTFSWVCMFFFKKIQPKKWNFYQNRINFYQHFGHFDKRNKFSVFKQKLIMQYNHIKYSTSF